MTPVEEQFTELKQRLKEIRAAVPAAADEPAPAPVEEAVLTPVGDGSFVVTVPKVATGPGWSASFTTVKFHVPVQYPTARPDCFWTEHGLTLADGRPPQNTGVNPIPGGGNGQLLWFSWHVTHWSPNDDTLITYLNVIRNRFADAR